MPNPHHAAAAALLLAASALTSAPSTVLARPPANVAAGSALLDGSAVRLALDDGRLGLYDAREFRLADGRCSDCPTPRQALWYFRDEPIAVPRAPGTSLPALVWLGAPDRIESAMLSSDGRSLRAGNGDSFAMHLAPKIGSNRSWFNESTLAFWRRREIAVRGRLDGNTFITRTIWPRDYTITPSTARFAPLRSPDELQAWVRAGHGGARSEFAARLIWQRAGVPAAWANKPVLAVMLNGAQGDDDEAHGGHFAIATGRLGPRANGPTGWCTISTTWTASAKKASSPR
jgi:hypothetical protein